MRMPALMLTLCMLAACGPQAPAPVAAAATASTDAFLVLPGDYSERTTRAALEARFGKDKVRVAADDDGPLLVLFPQDPGRRAYLRFHDGESFTNLASIQVRDSGSRWRGKQGVHIGMSLARLRELNGKPFGFFGFDPDRRAYVHDRWSPALRRRHDARCLRCRRARPPVLRRGARAARRRSGTGRRGPSAGRIDVERRPALPAHGRAGRGHRLRRQLEPRRRVGVRRAALTPSGRRGRA